MTKHQYILDLYDDFMNFTRRILSLADMYLICHIL